MKVHTELPALDRLLEPWSAALGEAATGYHHHALRVLNFALAFAGEEAESVEKLCLAAAFHDLGIWTDHTFDYLDPSRRLAREHLAHVGRQAWTEEIEAMIEFHHRIRPMFRRPLVEAFRKADWVDLSMGLLKFDLPGTFVVEVRAALPNAGFHRGLVNQILARMKRHPFNPLPMMRW